MCRSSSGLEKTERILKQIARNQRDRSNLETLSHRSISPHTNSVNHAGKETYHCAVKGSCHRDADVQARAEKQCSPSARRHAGTRAHRSTTVEPLDGGAFTLDERTCRQGDPRWRNTPVTICLSGRTRRKNGEEIERKAPGRQPWRCDGELLAGGVDRASCGWGEKTRNRARVRFGLVVGFIYSRNQRTIVRSKQTVEIGSRRHGLLSAQAGEGNPGPGPGCDLERGGA